MKKDDGCLVLEALDNSEAYRLYKKQLNVPIKDCTERCIEIIDELTESLSKECIDLKVSTRANYLKKYDLKLSRKYIYVTDFEIDKITKHFESKGFFVTIKKHIGLLPFRPRRIKITLDFNFSQRNK